MITTNLDIIYIYLILLTLKIADRKLLNICFDYYDLLVPFCYYLFLITIFLKIITTGLFRKLLYLENLKNNLIFNLKFLYQTNKL